MNLTVELDYHRSPSSVHRVEADSVDAAISSAIKWAAQIGWTETVKRARIIGPDGYRYTPARAAKLWGTW